MTKTVRMAALCAAASSITMATAAAAQTSPPAMSAECVQILNELNNRNAATAAAATMANGSPVPSSPWAAPTPTPTPSASPTPGQPNIGPVSPVVQPLPPTSPNTPNTPSTPPVTEPSTQPTTGGTTKYLTNPDGTRTRVSVKDGVTYYVGVYTPGYGHQNLATKKPYTAPTGGSVRMVGGQPIMAVAGVTTSGLSTRMINIIDELHITAAALGMAKPIITSATDGTHTNGSVHGSGNALDLRCQDKTSCTEWAMTLKQALGPGYDVMWEYNPKGGNHLHVEYDGHTA